MSASVEISLIIPARRCAHSLESTVREAHTFLTEKLGGNSFEIILVPNPAPGDTEDLSISVAEQLTRQYTSVVSYPHHAPLGKGAAIRTGIKASHGNWIFLTDADLPYDLDFFEKALVALRSGYDLVTGNRRLPSSYFSVPVELLRLAYRRHRLGLAFNQWVRWIFPIQTTDTQAGIKALSRRLAQEFCQRQTCPGFLFDLELFLTAIGHGYYLTEFPVTLHLNSEKSTVRILKECLLVAYWLTRIRWQSWKGAYGNKGRQNKKILVRYPDAPWNVRFFLKVRWMLTPYSQMAFRLPEKGTILDLGCGHGLLTLAAAFQSPARKILGIDHDAERVTLGALAVRDFPNIQIQKGSLASPPGENESYSGITMIDTMHYFDPKTQEVLLRKAYDLLEKGGTLLVREVDPERGATSVWNRFYEKIATKIGFTQSENQELYFRNRAAWENLMETAGFKVTSERCSSFLFADILYTCERPY